MKIVLILSILLCLQIASAFGQNKEVRFVIDTSIEIMKANAANTDKVNWPELKTKALEQARNAESIYQLGPVFTMLLQSLNDFHGTAFLGDSAYRWKRDEKNLSDSIKNAWKKGVYLQSQTLQGNIGYLRVPYMSMAARNELDKKAQDLNDSLCSLLNKNVNGIVLDLRLNGGGAMYPMMLGLEQLLHNGAIGSFTGKTQEKWILKNNSFYLDTILLTSIIPKCSMPGKFIPVVVLIGPATGSSGEFLAMSFKKRKNTIFLGTKSAGYVTAVAGFQVTNGVYLYLATGYGRDRDGEIYEKELAPDLYNDEPDSFNDIPNDKKVLEAIKWINSKK